MPAKGRALAAAKFPAAKLAKKGASARPSPPEADKPAGPTERGGPHRRTPAVRRDVMALSDSPRGLCVLFG